MDLLFSKVTVYKNISLILYQKGAYLDEFKRGVLQQGVLGIVFS